MLAERIREVFLNGTWIANTNYQDQLVNTNWEHAIYKFENLNSIAALTFHVNYYLEGLIQAFEKGKLEIRDSFSFDMPEIKNLEDWEMLREQLFINAKYFANLIENFDEAHLEMPFFEKKYGTNERNIEAILEHSYYHLGQISIFRKLMNQEQLKSANES